ncbi:uncharacterized protein MELLADRAFT_105018 [Melampsora larici-populina 98AG31]|uniref:Uncharacterized protein n=1 Tax=Melampsora larici-populina (strain 98AG31 / pathotype 3-4-7) TaxID=747676 RepID=F4RGN9_MELLP|nr:uncharacterized protein MELLADRAFT_105018 [Melampsora larici-populina 98AG31]EGG08593.1 hypothetical protein MELLADRAFT_105018 [Melampsora larici-populina 98AG31]
MSSQHQHPALFGQYGMNQVRNENGETPLAPAVNASGGAVSPPLGFGTAGLQSVPFLSHHSYSKAVMSHRPAVPTAAHGVPNFPKLPNLGRHDFHSSGTNTPGSITPSVAQSKTIHLDLDTGDERDKLDKFDWTPPFNNCSARIFEATMQSDLGTGSNTSGKAKATRIPSVSSTSSDDVVIEAPNKGKVADTINQDAAPGGNSAIFKLADAGGSVTITGSDANIQEFFAAVQLARLTEAGLSISMADPAKSAKMANTKIAMAQSRLKAMSAMNNSSVTSSQLADSIPLDPIQVKLESLIKKYGSLENHSREGWRVYKPHEASKYMQMNYEHLHKWAQELVSVHNMCLAFVPLTDDDPHQAKKQAGVDLENPPMYLEGFKWTDVKRPLLMSAPPPSAKKNKHGEGDIGHIDSPGGYAECQGFHI